MASPTCQGLTRAGNPCKATPVAHSNFCQHHQPEEPEFTEVCGHQNVHFEGDHEMVCELEKAHEGPHSAVFHAVDTKAGVLVFEGEKRTYWNDMAGIPVEQIEPGTSLKDLQ